MADREKVIKGLECCMKWTGEPDTATCHCSDCSYTNMDILGQRCLIDLINDALAMLKEQQDEIYALQVELASANELAEGYAELLKEQPQIVRCKDCKHYNIIGCAGGFGWCERYDVGHTDEWFCADGVAKDINVPGKEGR